MNVSVVILCFALMCNSLQGEQTESNSVYLIFCLAHQCNVLHSFEQRQKWLCYSYLFLERSVFLTKLIFIKNVMNSYECFYCYTLFCSDVQLVAGRANRK